MRTQSVDYEQAVVSIIRSLPIDRQAQVVDFARFVQWQLTTPPPFALEPLDTTQTFDNIRVDQEQGDPLDSGESEEEIHADNQRWDTLLASSESQSMLETLARQARKQFRAAQTLHAAAHYKHKDG